MTKQIKAIIIDDEPPARAILREYLQDMHEIDIIAECNNGRSAVEAINAQNPDLIFLDIQMPGLTGFQVLEHLEKLPKIIFSTAYDKFALQAFEVNAVDYLLKPYSRERFLQSIERILKYDARQDENLVSLLHALQPSAPQPERLFVKAGSRILPVAVDDLIRVEAAGDYARIHTHQRSFIVNMGISQLENRLDSKRFVRVHRSAIIALSALKHLESDGEGGYIATLKNLSTVRVSRTYAPVLRDLIV